jgi:PAS domain S-box-containing protein
MTPLSERLRLSSSELASAIEHVNCGIVAREPDGTMTYVNERLLSWLGYQRGQLVGRNIEMLIPPELRELLRGEMAASEGGDARARMTVLQRKDSTTFPVITLPHRIENEDGEYEGNIAIIIDLGAVQTAKPAGYEQSSTDVRSVLGRISLELQSISLTAQLSGTSQIPLHHPDVRELSPREIEVLSMLIDGSRVAAIATGLHISQHTVRNHLKSMYRKAGVPSQAALIEWVRSLDV